MHLKILNQRLAVCKLARITDANLKDEFFCLTKTPKEISLVCSEEFIPKDCISCETGWCGMFIQGELDFSLIGILSKITDVLACYNISVFVVSTFDTDYILMKQHNLERAIEAFQESGYSFT